VASQPSTMVASGWSGAIINVLTAGPRASVRVMWRVKGSGFGFGLRLGLTLTLTLTLTP